MQSSWVEDLYAFQAYVGPRPSTNHTLERMDNDKGYYEGNLKWATYAEQARNKGMYRNNTTGVTGVNLVEKKPGKWYYIAVWEKADGKQTNRVFSVDKYGKAEAIRLAIEIRTLHTTNLKADGTFSAKHGNKRKEL